MELRQSVIRYISEHKDVFEPFIEDEEGWDDYISRMAEDGAWAGHPELQAASLCLRRNIQVYQAGLPVWQITNWKAEDEAGPALRLSYHDGNHYNSVTGGAEESVEPAAEEQHLGDTGAESPSTEAAAAPLPDQSTRGRARKVAGRKVRLGVPAHMPTRIREALPPPVSVELTVAEDGERPVSVLLHVRPAGKVVIDGWDAGSVADHISVTWQKAVSRNKKCPCGSGRKYKACCALSAGVVSTASRGARAAVGFNDSSGVATEGVEAKLHMIHI